MKTNLNPEKYNTLICETVSNCTYEMKKLMKTYGLKRVAFEAHNIEDIPHATFEDGNTLEYKYEKVTGIFFDEDNNLIVRGETLDGYLDDCYGDFFNVADKIGEIYRALVDCIEKGDFKGYEYEDKYSYGVDKFDWDRIEKLVPIEDKSLIKSMKVTESNDKYDFIYVDCNEKLDGGNWCILREKESRNLYTPDNDGAYPSCLEDINTYMWLNEDKEKSMLDAQYYMIGRNDLVTERLTYLNNNFPDIFDGIIYEWQKNNFNILCVKSYYDKIKDIKNVSYVATYEKDKDIVPTKLFKVIDMELDFPLLF